jgi:hypothetical protein
MLGVLIAHTVCADDDDANVHQLTGFFPCGTFVPEPW